MSELQFRNFWIKSFQEKLQFTKFELLSFLKLYFFRAFKSLWSHSSKKAFSSEQQKIIKYLSLNDFCVDNKYSERMGSRPPNFECFEKPLKVNSKSSQIPLTFRPPTPPTKGHLSINDAIIKSMKNQ
jgi:hypothetical protein